MKRINKIRIKYVLLVSFFLILATILHTFMRYQVSVTANVVGYAKETRKSTYQVIFHSNYGTDETKSMTMNYNETKKLSPNTFTRENYNFIGWTTEKDGTGTNYTDEQAINNTTYVDDNKIELYAKWTQNSIYTVVYDSNTGEGDSMEPQVFVFGVPQKLKKSTFKKENYVFCNWNTKSDGTGISYEDEEEVNNLTNENGKIITLYAIYSREKYIHTGDITFDGKNGKNPCINTGICLFSEKNINRDFEVSFEIKNRVSTDNLATMMSAMNESGAPYPGMVYRIFNEWADQLVINASYSENVDKNYQREKMQKVTFKRINGAIYLSINDGPEEVVLDVSSMQTPFDVPVIFGASLDGNMEPQRWFQGTLSNLKIVVNDPNTNLGSIRYYANNGIGNVLSQNVLPNTTYKLMKNTYTREDYIFNGWNTDPNGTGTPYTDEQEVTNIVGSGEKLDLYAQWKKYKYTIKFNANNGTNNEISQEFESGTTTSLKPNEFTKDGYSFAFWNTKADGSGDSYEDTESVKNLCTEENQVKTLYAMYEQFSYQDNGPITFDGTNYIDTHIYLFSKKNFNKDFEISFEITDYNNTKNYNTIISSLDESGTPYPGFVFRINDSPEIENSTNEYNLEANASKSREINNCYPITTKKVAIKRVNGILYLKLDDNEEEQIIDYSTLSKKFYYPLTIGASLDKEFKAWRHFQGNISNLNITLSN